MSKTPYCIHTKELYSTGKIGSIVITECEKRKFKTPDLSHGYIADIAGDLKIEPVGKEGRRYVYRGIDVIPIIDRALELAGKKPTDKKGEVKQKPVSSPVADSVNKGKIEPTQIISKEIKNATFLTPIEQTILDEQQTEYFDRKIQDFAAKLAEILDEAVEKFRSLGG